MIFFFLARTHDFGRQKDYEEDDYEDNYYSYDSHSAASDFTGYSGVTTYESESESESDSSEEEESDEEEGGNDGNDIEKLNDMTNKLSV